MTENNPKDKTEVIQKLTQGSELLQLNISDESTNDLAVYIEELIKWNRRINLIAKKTILEDIIDKHFLDSLSVAAFIERQGKQKVMLVDVGTGAGFPGLVTAVVHPEWQIHLIEPRKKRVFFLKHIVRVLKLGNVTLTQGRIENERNVSPKYSTFITGRAVADPKTFLGMIRHLLTLETVAILMTAGKLNSWKWQTFDDDFKLVNNYTFTLPFSGSKRELSIVGLH